MKDVDSPTDAQINAFIDNELDDADKVRILNAINQDAETSRAMSEIRRDMELLALVYRNPPRAENNPGYVNHRIRTKNRIWLAVASLLLTIGIAAGWQLSALYEPQSSPVFADATRFSPNYSSAEKILIHINSMEQERVTVALAKTEEILQYARKNTQPVELEVVANAEGLGILRQGSPYAERIKFLADKYPNVQFMACGIAMENARLKEGKEIKLIPQATPIPAALGEILQKIKSGWLYVKS